MSDLHCLHCGATTHNGLALCELSQQKASTALEFLPVYFRNLARWRPPARPNGSLNTTGQWMLRRGEAGRNSITNALDLAGNDVATWAQCLADDRGIELPLCEDEAATFEATCDMLAKSLASIATLEWAGEFVTAVDEHERTLRTMTEAFVPGWYAGGCKRKIAMTTDEHDGLCGADTYVVPGLTWVKCRACGTTTFARDHVETILSEARGWTARPMRLAEALVALLDTELSVVRLHERIKKWTQRDHLTPIRKLDADGDEVGPKHYRFGEVLDRLLVEGATRPDADVLDNADVS